MKRIWDKIISRVMLLPLIVVAPLLSPVAGLIWWVCLVFGVNGNGTYISSVVPMFISSHDPIKKKIFISVWFMTKEFELFGLKKITRGRSGMELND
jgi:hypothetical protein